MHFIIQYSLLLQYEILEKLVKYIPPTIYNFLCPPKSISHWISFISKSHMGLVTMTLNVFAFICLMICGRKTHWIWTKLKQKSVDFYFKFASKGISDSKLLWQLRVIYVDILLYISSVVEEFDSLGSWTGLVTVGPTKV